VERSLEPLSRENAAELAAVLGEPEATWQRRAAGPPHWRNWLVRVDGEAVGYVQATGGDATEIAWVIAEPHRGRGHATAAARAVLAQLLGPVVAHIDPANAASEAVARRLGMTPGAARADGERRWSLPVQGGEQRP
jgi:RimJ/RimL family protein N-acetyltransferase